MMSTRSMLPLVSALAAAPLLAACPGEDPPVDSGGSTESSTTSDATTASDGPLDSSGDSPTAGPDCGDQMCGADEDCETCPGDCGPCEDPPVTECNDGIDNDGDGLVDWQLDMGCWSADDVTEASAPRDQESGFTTFDLSPDSMVVYVSSSDGDDANDGLSPQTPVATPTRGAELVRDGFPDFLLFKRGDTWRGMDLGPDRVARRFKSGPDPEHPIVIYSYGDSTQRPRLEIDKPFVDDDGNERSNMAIVGLAFISFPKIPGDPEFNGADGGALRFVGTGQNILIEDDYVEYGEFVVQNVSNVEVRNNVVYRSYHVGTCLEGDPSGDPTYRPSGMFAGEVTGLLIEGNVWDENGWNPDVPDACATVYNHDLYLASITDLTVRDNLILRASSIGIKLSASGPGAASNIAIEGNVFAEGEIGISMGGNANTEHRFVDARIEGNVFTDIGRAQPTGRTLTWYIDIIDNDGTEIRDNLLVNQPDLGNAYGIHLTGGSNRDVVIEGNFMHGLQRRAMFVDANASWSSLRVASNTMIADASENCLVAHNGPLGAFEYDANAYLSPASPDQWFCIDGTGYDLAGWSASAPETGPSEADAGGVEVRNLDSYAGELGFDPSLPAFAEQARMQSRHDHRPELTAPAARAYIREGYSGG
ncbi:right-handed parallel beta-helix repeat-containing protein [Paraliomyxa miuraensis]|uniref:right-handed parallel beta-helix repeat-containing protein n=1 Tax=Paraliomyxa miuraensis TaxID=376150 RepID=UPI002255EB23|nr:right-handed parallel beta-helix repeat-containing protein [Paraliomyxa miuraensis]MCX4241174.1 right-handed parallel beta-helix repeat-containing protein [Paraliomyxa miuraensis]